jgi:DNA-binding transcriptional LysR family regulator
MILGQRVANLAAGEADIAIRGGTPGSDALIGRKICEVPWAVFASKGYTEKYGRPASVSALGTHPIIELVDEIKKLPAAKWLRANAPNSRVAARCGNIPSAHLAVKSGAGIAALPYVYAASDHDLVCLTGPIPELNYPMYLLVHKDMRKVRRVSAFFDFSSRELKTVLLSGNMRAR